MYLALNKILKYYVLKITKNNIYQFNISHLVILVKTLHHGYIPAELIGTSNIHNPGHGNRNLFKCSTDKYNELLEDLYIGGHSILVDTLSQEETELTNLLFGTTHLTDDKYRLLALADFRTEPYMHEGVFTVYHIALEHSNPDTNYGIYTNGLLVESCSKNYLLSKMNIHN